MRATLLLILTASLLGGCVETGPGYYDDPYYQPGPYYRRHGEPGYAPPYNNYDQQRRRMETNCNMNWQNCVGVCNTMRNPQQRAVCVANCNNALNQCKSRY